jgi:hypothetical protein
MHKKDLSQKVARRRLDNGFERGWIDLDPHRIGARSVTPRRSEPHRRERACFRRRRVADRDKPREGDGASRGDDLARRPRRAPCSRMTCSRMTCSGVKGAPQLVLEDQDAAGQSEQQERHAQCETRPQVNLANYAPGHVSAQCRSRL